MLLTLAPRRAVIYAVLTNQNNDKETPLPQLPSVAGALDTLVKLHVALLGVFQYGGSLLLRLLEWCFLQYNSFGQVLKQLAELDKGTLNLLNVVVSRADRTKDTLSSSRSVRFQLNNI